MDRIRWFTALAITLLVACRDQVTAPRASPQTVTPSLSTSASSTCPATATFTVNDEAGLRSALAAAAPGDVIAINGMIGISVDDTITTDRVTLTCATPGSGLFALGSDVVGDLLAVVARQDTIEGLVLDASGTFDAAVFAFNDGLTAFAEDERFTNNTITCGFESICIFVAGAPRSYIANNQLAALGSISGIHLQGGVDGSRIQENTIVDRAPSLGLGFGGIRVRDGSNVVVANNVVLGPWGNAMAPANLTSSLITRNRLEGPLRYGMRMFTMNDDLFLLNHVSGAGIAGALVAAACGNVFSQNDLESNDGGIGIIFEVTTGANIVIGNQTGGVADNGAFDCDGDGVNDANHITGSVLRGMMPGDVTSDVVMTRHGIILK